MHSLVSILPTLPPSLSLPQCVSVDQLEVLSAASRERLATNQYQQVVDIILTMRCVGKHSLHFPTSIKTPILEVSEVLPAYRENS